MYLVNTILENHLLHLDIEFVVFGLYFVLKARVQPQEVAVGVLLCVKRLAVLVDLRGDGLTDVDEVAGALQALVLTA